MSRSFKVFEDPKTDAPVEGPRMSSRIRAIAASAAAANQANQENEQTSRVVSAKQINTGSMNALAAIQSKENSDIRKRARPTVLSVVQGPASTTTTTTTATTTAPLVGVRRSRALSDLVEPSAPMAVAEQDSQPAAKKRVVASRAPKRAETQMPPAAEAAVFDVKDVDDVFNIFDEPAQTAVAPRCAEPAQAMPALEAVSHVEPPPAPAKPVENTIVPAASARVDVALSDEIACFDESDASESEEDDLDDDEALDEDPFALGPEVCLDGITDDTCIVTAEHKADLYEYYRDIASERQPSPTYMSLQTDINHKMRTILIDWLVEVHLKFRMRPETLYLTVNLIDRFLEKKLVARTKLQLVGCGALFIASKFEEIYSPEVRDFVYITDKAYSAQEVMQMETIMLNTLDFYLTVPTPVIYSKKWVEIPSVNQGYTELTHWTHFFLDLALLDIRFLEYNPSDFAAVAVAFARCLHACPSLLPIQVLAECSFEDDQDPSLHHGMVLMHSLWVHGDAREKAVRKKYALPKFGAVSKHQFRLAIEHANSGFHSVLQAPAVMPGQLAQQAYDAHKQANRSS